MKVVRSYGRFGEQYLDLEDAAFNFQTSEALVKTKFRMLNHWFEEVKRLKKENRELKQQLEKLSENEERDLSHS